MVQLYFKNAILEDYVMIENIITLVSEKHIAQWYLLPKVHLYHCIDVWVYTCVYKSKI